MIICFCKNVSQSDIIQELKKNITIEEALRNLKAGTGCGCCLLTIEDLFHIDTSKLLDYTDDNQ
jgi:NAD(P)H-nitrite reductase large subunit